MNGVDICNFCGRDDGGNVEIAVGRTRRTDADGLVGKANMQGVAVSFTVDGDGANAEFPAGVEHAQRNFTAIGNQDLTKHSDPLRAGSITLRAFYCTRMEKRG